MISTRAGCNLCPSGRFGNISGATSLGECVLCPVGKYKTGDSVAEKASSCDPCPQGRYQDSTGKNTCKLCQKGTYGKNVIGGASNAADGCAECDAGKYGDTPGATSEQEGCYDCPSGRFGAGIGLDSFDKVRVLIFFC